MAISGSTKISTNQNYLTPSKDKNDKTGVDKEGNYFINLKDSAGGDRVDIAANKGIHALVNTDKDDKVFLNGWKEDTSKAKNGVRYFSNEDGSSQVSVIGEGTVDTSPQQKPAEDPAPDLASVMEGATAGVRPGLVGPKAGEVVT